MILHLCHHWFWITTLSVLLTMTVIVKAHEDKIDGSREHGNVNASHPTPVRTKFKAVLLNVTRLYPVQPDTVPDNTNSSKQELSATTEATFSPSRTSASSSPSETERPESEPCNIDERDTDGQFSIEHIDTSLFATSREVFSVPETIVSSKPGSDQPLSSYSSTSELTTGTPSDTTHLLTENDSNLMNTNQSERLEREIRKNNTTENTNIELHPSYEPESDGLEHDKLSHHTQEFARTVKPATTESNYNSSSEEHEEEQDEVKYEREEGGYTIYVTPPSPYSSSSSPSSSNDLTTQTPSIPKTQAPSTTPPTPPHVEVIVVKKSEMGSKIKDKTSPEVKAKFSSKIKDKTTTLKPVSPMTDTKSNSNSSIQELLRTHPGLSSDTVEDTQNSTTSASQNKTTNGSSLADYEIMNDPPVAQENVTDVALENTSISADYQDVNLTTSASVTSNLTRTSAHGRMLDVAPPDSPRAHQAHAEDLSNPWSGEGGVNVAMISGISFGALALVTLFGAVSFIMYRRYRWNKPQTLSDKCSNPDSSGYIDDSTLRENSEEMYSLDNDSFLNSLEAMTIQNYWTDHVKHTKL